MKTRIRGKVILAASAGIVLAACAWRVWHLNTRVQDAANASNGAKSAELTGELLSDPPKGNRTYSTGEFRRLFVENRATLEKIVTMAREEHEEVGVGWGIYLSGMSVERQNDYRSLLRELGSRESVSVNPDPFEVEVVIYNQGLSVSGMVRGYVYSPKKEPSPPVFVDNLDSGMKEHPDGWQIIYVPLGDSWYIYCDWR